MFKFRNDNISILMDPLQLRQTKKYLFRNGRINVILQYLWPSTSRIFGDYKFRIVQNLNEPDDSDACESVHLSIEEVEKHVLVLEANEIIKSVSDLYGI